MIDGKAIKVADFLCLNFRFHLSKMVVESEGDDTRKCILYCHDGIIVPQHLKRNKRICLLFLVESHKVE